jgi:hypothetical protein
MPLLPIPPYRPDVSDYEGEATQTILNVVPRADGYGPFPDFTVVTSALAAPAAASSTPARPTARSRCSPRRRPSSTW